MFWRSLVGKLAVTILLLVSFVLLILTISLLQFFERFHIQEAEKQMMQTATKISDVIVDVDDEPLILDTMEKVKDPAARVIVLNESNGILSSDTENIDIAQINNQWFLENKDIKVAQLKNKALQKQIKLKENDVELMVVGKPIENTDAFIIVIQSLDVVNQTKAETTRIIFLAAGIAIILTTIFAFFLSTRITSPLIKMREAAFDITRGEFNTEVPILTHDELGELAIAFNRMGRQLNFHIDALRQEKEQMSSIVTSMADGVMTLNRDGEIIVVNPPAEKFLEDWYYEKNLTSDEYELPDDIREVLNLVIEYEEQQMQELSLQGRNWVMIMTPLHDQSYVRGAVAVIRDMTEERQLDKLRKDFISNVSHELRTPISLMQGYSEAIVDDIAESKEDKNELAQIIHDESLRMGRLVNELLDLGRMEAGHIQLNKTEVHIDSFAQRILNKFYREAERSNISLIFDQVIEKETAFIDEDRVEQVMTNLIQNAINHTKENGHVTLSVKNNERFLSVEVTDDGVGIPEEDLPFIFERFYKADKSRTRSDKKKGTGLGLAIAKNIVEAHNGSIYVKSKENIGTTFSFKLYDD
ncbi:MAG TPA: ATP-binding protein [Bacillota bacterium]|nr:ATP-binding protein [Bacillota bacterium]